MLSMRRLALRTMRVAAAAMVGCVVGACGGGGGGDGFSATGGYTNGATTISGVVSEGPVSGAQVCALAVYGGAVQAPIVSCVNTDNAGRYSINLGVYTGPVLLQATKGVYIDEATGLSVNMADALPNIGLRSLVVNASGNMQVAITTLTEIAFEMAYAASGGLTAVNTNAAIGAVNVNFGVGDIVGTLPVDPLNVPVGVAGDQKTYALALGVVSQYLAGKSGGNTLAAALATLQGCLAAPVAANCGSGTSSVGYNLNSALTAFEAAHPAFANVALPVAAFGSVGSGKGSGGSTGLPLSLLAGVADPITNSDGPSATATFNLPQGTAADDAGNIYVADSSNHTIRKLTPAGLVSTLAGSPGVSTRSLPCWPCTGDGIGALANFTSPEAVAYDHSTGMLYVADTGDNTIRAITLSGTATGTVTTIAGYPGANAPSSGTGDAPVGTNGIFGSPSNLASDGAGHLYVSDMQSGLGYIRLVNLAAPYALSTVAGGASAQYACGSRTCTTYYLNGTGASAGFGDGNNGAHGLAFDRSTGNPNSGSLLVADYGANAIRRVTPGGIVTTYAGAASTDGSGVTLPFSFGGVQDLAVDAASGDLYVLDVASSKYGNSATVFPTIWRITPAGTVSALAGGSARGYADGIGAAAQFNPPFIAAQLFPSAGSYFSAAGMAFDASSGNLFVAEDRYIRQIAAGGAVTTAAGFAQTGSQDGPGSAARFFAPFGLASDVSGRIYVTDAGTFDPITGAVTHVDIRAITTTGDVTTLAGSSGVAGFGDGSGTAAMFGSAGGLCYDTSSGNPSSGSLLVADGANNAIRMVTLAGTVTTYAGPLPTDPTAGASGFVDGTGDAASFSQPAFVAIDAAGNAFVTDSGNNAIRRIAPGGVVVTIAGPPPGDPNAGTSGFADGTASAALFNDPTGIAVDANGNIYVADTNNNAIRKITADGVVSTLAGRYPTDPTAGLPGNTDGTGDQASFNGPRGLVVDSNGNIYVADTGNNLIRKVTPSGVVTTITVQPGSAAGLPVALVGPTGLALFGGTLYVNSLSGVVYVANVP